jgi:hypothetical protein
MQIGRVIEETVVVPDSVVEAVDEVPSLFVQTYLRSRRPRPRSTRWADRSPLSVQAG